ncbi:MAG: YhcH/YjgK/YiaL family protein [Peptostreptococcaceae bacterium]
MIYGNLNNDKDLMVFLPEAIKKGIAFLKETDLLNCEAKEYEIQGREIYANVIDTRTKSKEDIRPEVHRKYIDIQCLCNGNEIIGFSRDCDENVVDEEILEKDLIFYSEVKNETELVLSPNDYVILFPEDVHRPAYTNNEHEDIRKVVVKISVDLIK